LEGYGQNEEVLEGVNENRCLIKNICERKQNWIKPVLRENGLQRDVLEVRMWRKRVRGRSRMKMIADLIEDGVYE